MAEISIDGLLFTRGEDPDPLDPPFFASLDPDPDPLFFMDPDPDPWHL